MPSSLRVLTLASCAMALAACGGDAPAPIEPPPTEQPAPSSDPCAPNGHIHREPTGDWCHCDRGHMASEQGLSCLPDPGYVPRDGFDFGDNGQPGTTD